MNTGVTSIQLIEVSIRLKCIVASGGTGLYLSIQSFIYSIGQLRTIYCNKEQHIDMIHMALVPCPPSQISPPPPKNHNTK